MTIYCLKALSDDQKFWMAIFSLHLAVHFSIWHNSQTYIIHWSTIRRTAARAAFPEGKNVLQNKRDALILVIEDLQMTLGGTWGKSMFCIF